MTKTATLSHVPYSVRSKIRHHVAIVWTPAGHAIMRTVEAAMRLANIRDQTNAIHTSLAAITASPSTDEMAAVAAFGAWADAADRCPICRVDWRENSCTNLCEVQRSLEDDGGPEEV